MRLPHALTALGLGLLGALVGLVGACDQVQSFPLTPDTSIPSGWTVIAAGTTNNLNAVSGVSDSAVWAVGDRGTILYWNGTQLVAETSGTRVTLRGVWAVDVDHVYAVGDGGTILQRQAGGTWQVVGAKTTAQVLTAVWADATRVVAVGSNGTVVLGTAAMGATTYQLLSNPDTENLFGVTGTPGGVVMAAGALGLVVQINGMAVTRTPISAFSKLLTAVATAGSSVFLVGQEGTVFQETAGGFNLLPGCPVTSLRAVSTVASASAGITDVWSVGWDGTVCKLHGGAATSFPYSDARWFNGVYAASATSLYVVGASGTFLRGLPVLSAPDGGGALGPSDASGGAEGGG